LPITLDRKQKGHSPKFIIDMEVLDQLLEMDGSSIGGSQVGDNGDEEEEEDTREVEFGLDEMLHYVDGPDREFSRKLVWNYFEQAEVTIRQMDTAL
jgi:hypothetical protein